MFEVKATIFGLINGMLTLLVALMWELALQWLAGVQGEPTLLTLWLAANVMLMGAVLKEFNRRPRPSYIIKQGLISPIWIGLYANYLLHHQRGGGGDDSLE